MTIQDKQIVLDDDFAKKIGFTSDKFGGYLWLVDDAVFVSFIVSKQPQQGNLNKLFDSIWHLGYKIKVPTPILNMKEIVRKKGFEQINEYSKEMDESVEVWVK